MSDGIRVGTNASLTVAEAARADDGLILGADPDGDREGEHERANRSLAAFAREGVKTNEPASMGRGLSRLWVATDSRRKRPCGGTSQRPRNR